ncbi:hypothetical protein LIER_11435 [Lithospermum erythrorhizon]|uniref:Replication protein A OB domain-containing protein n=1 Tax=Lithospermum erythrorhizon TaxID=34254 RepID=A0AAV3PPL2_LITER
MEHNTMLTQINIRTRNWTCRITIIEDISILTVTTGLRIKRYVLADDEENQVSATIFGSHIPILSPRLQLFTVHEITNAQQFPQQLDTNIVIFSNQRPKTNNFEIMGVVIAYEDPTNVVADGKLKKIQRFTFVDMEMISICITLWDEMTLSQGPLLMEVSNSRAVVIAKRLGFSTYNGTSLAARNNTSFTINPPIETALNFKSWVESRTGPELRAMLVDQSLSRSKQRVDEGTETVHSVAELQNMTRPGDYWIRAFLQIHEEEQKYAHQEGIAYTCYNCDKEVTAVLRMLVVMSASDGTGIVKIAAIGSIAERILQTTAINISKLSNLGEHYDLNSIRSEVHQKSS